MHRLPDYPRRPWYGTWRLVVAVALAVTLVPLTVAFLAFRVEALVSGRLGPLCESGRAGMGPLWTSATFQWADWLVSIAAGAIALRAAVFHAARGRRPRAFAAATAVALLGVALLTTALTRTAASEQRATACD